MSIGLVGRKCGMSRVFTDDGRSIPVTLIEATPNRVTQVKTVETDGYNAVQVTRRHQARRADQQAAGRPLREGEGRRRVAACGSSASKPARSASSRSAARSRPTKCSRSARWSTSPASRRARASRARSSASTSRWATRRTATRCRIVRRARSASARRRAACSRARRWPATWARAPFAMNLEVVKIDNDRHLIAIKGSVPGAPGGDVIIRPAVKAKK